MNPWSPQKIKALRQAMGLRQGPFGDLVGVGDKCVSWWENGVSTPGGPSRRMLSRLAADLGSRWDDVCRGLATSDGPPVVSEVDAAAALPEQPASVS